MAKKDPVYKPLLFTTTIRNPLRMKRLLNVLYQFNGQTLTNELAIQIMKEVIKIGLYRPIKTSPEIIEKWGGKKISRNSQIGKEVLTNQELDFLVIQNPQKHNEAGFSKGWPSRFATVFDFPKELGFVFFNIGERLEFSKVGSMLAESVTIDIDDAGHINYAELHPLVEQQVFLHALAKSQRSNPFVRVLNDNVPLILLLEVIRLLNADNNYNSAGISLLELPLIIFWKDNNAKTLYDRIVKLRAEYGYKPSWEVIIDICIEEIMGGNYKKFEPKSIMVDYPDEFIRKMRLTGLISLRGGGRFIDINKNEIEKVNYVLEHYTTYPKFATEREYFDYMATVDVNLIQDTSIKLGVPETNELLTKWLEIYDWKKIKDELKKLGLKKLSTDSVLKLLTAPVRLEFLTALAIKSRFPEITVKPNYPSDDEGIPTSTASGSQGDIECYENNNGILVEVTMSEGRTQTMMEVWPITRHLEEFKNVPDINEVMCHFIAPCIFIDSTRQIEFSNREYQVNIKANTIQDFITFLENNNQLYKA